MPKPAIDAVAPATTATAKRASRKSGAVTRPGGGDSVTAAAAWMGECGAGDRAQVKYAQVGVAITMSREGAERVADGSAERTDDGAPRVAAMAVAARERRASPDHPDPH